MTTYFWRLLLAVVMFAQAGCNDNAFLEEKPTTFYTIDNVFSTSEQVDQVLIALYTLARDLKTGVGNAWVHDMKMKGTDMFDVSSIRLAGTFSDYSIVNPLHDTFYNAYSAWYYMVARANLALYAIDLPQITWASDDDKAYAEAQARFFRAYAYKNLAQLFGGVALVKELQEAPRFDYVRSSRVETYQYAIDELLAVLEDLPETTVSGGRIVRGAAQHNLAELYLSMGTQLAADGKAAEAQAAFASSVNYANLLIDGGTYRLIGSRFGSRKAENKFTFNVYRNGTASTPTKNNVVDTIQVTANYYWDLFQEGNINYQDGNTECIWAVQVDLDAYKTGKSSGSRLEYPRVYGPVMRDVHSTVIRGTLEDVGGRGIGSIIPTMYTRDVIYEGKFAKDMRNSEAVFRRRFKGNYDNAANLYYRKDIPWDYLYYGKPSASDNDNARSLCFPLSCKISTDKFSGLDKGENMSHLFRDEYIIRLSETVLVRAEAKQRSGDKTGAAADINILRKRAKCDYEVTAADMDDKFDMILDERARELVYEEYRWQTLLRMGGTIASDRIRKYAYWPATAATLTFNYNLWPIPQTVLDSNKDSEWKQNPGWENR